MTTKSPQNEEGIIAFLSSVLKKNEVSPENFQALTSCVENMSDQMLDMSKAIEYLMIAIQSQQKTIADLYKVQEFLLAQLQAELTAASTAEPSLFVDVKKNKNEKPN